MDDDDDMPTLPADTLALLQNFQNEKASAQQKFEALKSNSENAFAASDPNAKLTMDLFGEDWQISQFWYSDATANTLAEALLDGADGSTSIAVVSAPSVYIALRNILASPPWTDDDGAQRPALRLLEYDRRFAVLGSDFEYYDYQSPLALPQDLKGKFDRIICDPPFLSEDCQAKTALTARFLAKSWSQESLRLISCTGERMEDLITGKLYRGVGVKTTSFEVVHAKGLSNEFRCFASFEGEGWRWRSE